MNIYEFGIENQRKLLFFQGSCTCWKDYMPSIELLSKEFYVIVPALEGYDPAKKTDFISVEKNVGDTTDYLLRRGYKELYAAYGLSMYLFKLFFDPKRWTPASLDVENETKIQAGISELIRNKTVLIIAHRMRTVANAHKIVVLKDGTVAEQGTPAELLARGGEFARMVERQKEG